MYGIRRSNPAIVWMLMKEEGGRVCYTVTCQTQVIIIAANPVFLHKLPTI